MSEGKKKSYVPSRRMTRQELMLLLTIQDKSNIDAFIRLRQYLEPQSVQDRRKSRYRNKAKVLKDYEKL